MPSLLQIRKRKAEEEIVTEKYKQKYQKLIRFQT